MQFIDHVSMTPFVLYITDVLCSKLTLIGYHIISSGNVQCFRWSLEKKFFAVFAVLGEGVYEKNCLQAFGWCLVSAPNVWILYSLIHLETLIILELNISGKPLEKTSKIVNSWRNTCKWWHNTKVGIYCVSGGGGLRYGLKLMADQWCK